MGLEYVKDRQNYKKHAGKAGENAYWMDITGQEERLWMTSVLPSLALDTRFPADMTTCALI